MKFQYKNEWPQPVQNTRKSRKAQAPTSAPTSKWGQRGDSSAVTIASNHLASRDGGCGHPRKAQATTSKIRISKHQHV